MNTDWNKFSEFLHSCSFYHFSHIEQPHGKNKPSTGRKTWEQFTPIKKREPQRQNMATSSTRPETGRDQVLFGADSYANGPPVHSSTPRKQDLSSSGLVLDSHMHHIVFKNYLWIIFFSEPVFGRYESHITLS